VTSAAVSTIMCENRIVKITKDAGDVAKFTYDALGRRVEKQDCKAGANTRRFYHNYKWQVLSEYDGSNNYVQSFVYGNYIDEVLMMDDASSAAECDYYYLHDHLYSPTVLLMDLGAGNYGIGERYEYDAYGSAHIYTGAGADSEWFTSDDVEASPTASAKGNSYLFTGRRLDILDGGSLKIYYYRNRYYDPVTGRFLTHDPLGITPNGGVAANRFESQTQYANGLNAYEYVRSMPLTRTDPYGLWHYDLPPSQRYLWPRALVLPDEDQGDSLWDIDGLARYVRLDPKEIKFWGKFLIKGPGKCGWEVPNRFLIVVGEAWGLGREYNTHWSWAVWQAYEKRGFKVLHLDFNANKSLTSNDVLIAKDHNLWGFAFFGHGTNEKKWRGDFVLRTVFPLAPVDLTSATDMSQNYHYGMILSYFCFADSGGWGDLVSVNGTWLVQPGRLWSAAGPRTLGWWGSWDSLIGTTTPPNIIDE
jgi:RHS repeat-associated protein